MIELYKPKIEDLWFKEEMLSCKETMAYNKRYGGCISFSSDMWESWYNRWMNDPTKFYRYVVVDGEFVGEVAYHYDNEEDMYLVDVIIKHSYRRRGYGEKALMLLCDVALKNGVNALYDNIDINNSAVKLFLKCGFSIIKKTKEYIVVKKDLDLK